MRLGFMASLMLYWVIKWCHFLCKCSLHFGVIDQTLDVVFDRCLEVSDDPLDVDVCAQLSCGDMGVVIDDLLS